MVNVKRPPKSTARQREIAAKLRALREAKGWSLQGVAAKMVPPISHQRLFAWETGEYRVSIDRLEQLADIYGINPAVLLGYDNWKPKRRKSE